MPYAQHNQPPEPETGREPLGMVDIDEALAAAWALLPRAASVNLYLEAHQHRCIPGIPTRSEMLYQFCICWGDGSVMRSHCTGRYLTLREALDALERYAHEHAI